MPCTHFECNELIIIIETSTFGWIFVLNFCADTRTWLEVCLRRRNILAKSHALYHYVLINITHNASGWVGNTINCYYYIKQCR